MRAWQACAGCREQIIAEYTEVPNPARYARLPYVTEWGPVWNLDGSAHVCHPLGAPAADSTLSETQCPRCHLTVRVVCPDWGGLQVVNADGQVHWCRSMRVAPSTIPEAPNVAARGVVEL